MYIFVENVYCVKKEIEWVNRTWKERLFSTPWKPWRSRKLVTISFPDPDVYVMGNRIIGHPVTLAKLRSELNFF